MCTPTLMTAALLTGGTAASAVGGLSGVATIASTFMGVQQQRAQGRFQKGIAEYNARVAENQAQATRTAGIEKENIQRQRTAELLSKQRAQLGAAGVELGSGSALQLQEDTMTLGEADALRIRSGTEERVGALETRAELTRGQGTFAEAAAGERATGTLLSGTAGAFDTGVADKWFKPDSAVNTLEFAP